MNRVGNETIYPSFFHTHYAHPNDARPMRHSSTCCNHDPQCFPSFLILSQLKINFSFFPSFPFSFSFSQKSTILRGWSRSTGSFNIRPLLGTTSKVARKRGSLEGFPGVVYAKDVYPRRINVGRLTNRERIASRVCGLLAQSSIAGCQLKHPLSWHVTGACLLAAAFQGRAPGPEILAILLVMELIYPMPRSLILEKCNHAIPCDTRSLDFYRARKHVHFVPLSLRWDI